MEIVPFADPREVVEKVEIEFWNTENKKSVYNLMPKTLKKSVDNKKVKELLTLEEWELKKLLGHMSPTLNRLRYAFWNEYYRAVDSSTPMRQRNIFAGVCTAEVYSKFLDNHNNLAWILCPPTDTVIALKETLNHGLDRIREILDLPLYKIESVKVGKDEFEDREVVDEKTANLMLKAVAMIDLRLHGSYVQVQKVEQQTTNINQNINTTNNNPPTYIEHNDIDAELIRLRNEVVDEAKKVEKPFNMKEVQLIEEHDINPREITNVKDTTLIKAKLLDEIDITETDEEVMDEL